MPQSSANVVGVPMDDENDNEDNDTTVVGHEITSSCIVQCGNVADPVVGDYVTETLPTLVGMNNPPHKSKISSKEQQQRRRRRRRLSSVEPTNHPRTNKRLHRLSELCFLNHPENLDKGSSSSSPPLAMPVRSPSLPSMNRIESPRERQCQQRPRSVWNAPGTIHHNQLLLRLWQRETKGLNDTPRPQRGYTRSRWQRSMTAPESQRPPPPSPPTRSRNHEEQGRDNNYRSLVNSSSPATSCHRWRPYVFCDIDFQELQTPYCDVILGMDRSGSYLVALGHQDKESSDEPSELGLYIRYYGIPSKAKLLSPTKPISPLLMSFPLGGGIKDFHSLHTAFLPRGLGFYVNLALCTPVACQTSLDNTLGVARFHKVEPTEDGSDDSISFHNLTLYTLPHVAKQEFAHVLNLSVYPLRLWHHSTCSLQCHWFSSLYTPARSKATEVDLSWDIEYDWPCQILLVEVAYEWIRQVWVRPSTLWSNETNTTSLPCRSLQCSPVSCDYECRDLTFFKLSTCCLFEYVRAAKNNGHEDTFLPWTTGTVSDTSVNSSSPPDASVTIEVEIGCSITDLSEEIWTRFRANLAGSNRNYFRYRFIHQRKDCRAWELSISWELDDADPSGIAVFILVDLVSCRYAVLKWVHLYGSYEECWEKLVAYRCYSHHFFAGDSRLNSSKTWYFLERDPSGSNYRCAFWKLKQQHCDRRAPSIPEIDRGDCLNNYCVLNGMPVQYFENSSIPIRISYSNAVEHH